MGAFDQGFAFGASTAERQAAHKQAYSDEEHETLLNGYNNTISNLQQRMATVGNNSPEYSGLQNQLNQVVADRTSLFHPERPGGIERLGKLLWSRVHGEPTVTTDPTRIAVEQTPGTQGTTLPGMGGGPSVTSPTLPALSVARDTLPNAPTVIPTAGEAKARFAQDLSYGLTPQNPLLLFKKNVMEALPHLQSQDVDKIMEIQAGLAPKPVMLRPTTPHWVNYKLPDGSFKEFNLNDQGTPIPEGATPVSAQTTPHESTAALATYIRTWFPNGTTPEQREWAINRFKRLNTPGSTSSHEQIQYDSDGNPHIVRLNTSSQKEFFGPDGPPPANADGSSVQLPGVGSGKTATVAAPLATGAAAVTTLSGQPVTAAQSVTAAPKTPAEAKKRASAVRKNPQQADTAATEASPDPRLAGLHKNTPAQTAADKKVGDFTALTKQADLAEKAPEDAVKQRSLILALIRASAGRVNMQEYDSYVKRQGLANTIEQWANNAQTGALPADIFKKIIGVTRDYMAGAKAAQQEAYKNTNVKDKNGSADPTDIDSIVNALNAAHAKGK
jgi:hypothetical protein